MKEKETLSPNNVLAVNILATPVPTPEIANKYIGLSESEIKEQFHEVIEFDGIYPNEHILEIRLSDSTLNCIFDEQNICIEAYIFSDDI